MAEIEILFNQLEEGDLFRSDGVLYKALGEPEPTDDDEMELPVCRMSGPDTVTGISPTKPGADWTDVQYVTRDVPVVGPYTAEWDTPVTRIE